MSLYYSPPPGGNQDSITLFWGFLCHLFLQSIIHNLSLLQYVCNNVL